MNLSLKIRKSAGVPVTAPVHRLITEGNVARDRGAWTEAAEGYRQALDQDPDLTHIWIQYGHALKEAGDHGQAEAAYQRATATDPKSAEAFFHLGRARKLRGDAAGARRAHLTAARIDPRHPEAGAELRRLASDPTVSPEELTSFLEQALGGQPAVSEDATSASKAARTALATLRDRLLDDRTRDHSNLLMMTGTASELVDDIMRELSGPAARSDEERGCMLFDASDLMAYFRDSRLPTGIQRVQIEVISQALAWPGAQAVRVCCFVAARDAWVEIPRSSFLALSRLSLSGGDRNAPEWVTAVTRAQLLLGSADAITLPPGSCLINLGTSWWIPNYFLTARKARAVDGTPIRYIPFVHDLIPLRAPQVCAKGLTQEFIGWLLGVFDHADAFLVNSEATKRDLLAAAADLGRDLSPDTVHVVRLDADPRKPATAPPRPEGLAAWGLKRTPYVLFVSTIEARKNHVLAFDAWLELIRHYGVKNVPKLVCVGKRGWLDDAVHARLATHEELRDRVLMLSGLSDGDLEQLYKGCLFTLYPSTFEGWGLPVTESLCYGKVPVTSDGSSLPEAGGRFAVYFEAGSAARLHKAVDQLLSDPAHLKKLEDHVAAEFRPRTWSDLAEQIVAIVDELRQTPSPVRPLPFAELGAYHPLARNIQTRIWRGLRSAEGLRADGWWGQDDFGCWSKPEGGVLRFRLRRPHGPLRLYLRVVGLPGRETRAFVEVDGLDTPSSIEIGLGETKWMAVDLAASHEREPTHDLVLQGEDMEHLAERTAGSDTRVISIGLAGFFLCEADDAAARAAFSEAVALGQLGDLAFNRPPPMTISTPA